MKTIITFLVSILYISAFAQIFSTHNPDPSNFGNYITEMVVDGDNLVCISRGEKILSTYDGSSWTTIDRQNYGFESDAISAARELDLAPNGDIWIAHYSGVDQFDGTTVTNYLPSNSELPHEYMRDLAIDTNNVIVFGFSNGNGISILENGTWTHDGAFTGGLALLNDIFLPSFIELDRAKNEIWIDDGGDLYNLKEGQVTKYDWQNYPVLGAIGTDEINGMTVTEDGRVWFSINDNNFNNGGLLVFDGTDWEHITSLNSDIPYTDVTAITSHGDDIIIGNFYSNDVAVFDGTDWVVYDESNSNFPAFGYATCYEMKTIGDKIFIGTSNGVVEMDLSDPTPTLDLKSKIGYSIFPNPTADFINIKGGESIEDIQVLNVHGKVLLQKSFSDQIDISFLPKGIYFLNIKNEQQEFYATSIVKF